jgi:hypothetical protein
MVIENVNVYGLENSIRGSKYPMSTDIDSLNSDITKTVKSLASSEKGAGHDQFLTGIIAQFDLTFTVKAWTEAERYHFLDFISSQSTMHRITKFDLDKSYIKYVDPRIVEIIKEKVKEYNDLEAEIKKWESLGNVVNMSKGRELLKEKYLEILYSNPCGFKLTAAMTTNYRQLKTIVSQRENHRLPEWREFCKQVEEFPYFKELIYKEN